MVVYADHARGVARYSARVRGVEKPRFALLHEIEGRALENPVRHAGRAVVSGHACEAHTALDHGPAERKADNLGRRQTKLFRRLLHLLARGGGPRLLHVHAPDAALHRRLRIVVVAVGMRQEEHFRPAVRRQHVEGAHRKVDQHPVLDEHARLPAHVRPLRPLGLPAGRPAAEETHADAGLGGDRPSGIWRRGSGICRSTAPKRRERGGRNEEVSARDGVFHIGNYTISAPALKVRRTHFPPNANDEARGRPDSPKQSRGVTVRRIVLPAVSSFAENRHSPGMSAHSSG